MSGDRFALCADCGEGLVREDPQTGDARCGNCGGRPEEDPPLVLGGQGRTAEELSADARVLWAFALGMVLTVTVLVGLYVAVRTW